MLKRLVSLDEECETILKSQPEKKVSAFVRKAIKNEVKRIDEPEKPPVYRVKING